MAGKKPAVRQAAIVTAFAQRLREVRTSLGMTQQELAGKAEMTLSYVSRLEAGGAAPGIDTLERLANALGTGVMELLPPPKQSKTEEGEKKHVKELFDLLMLKAGPETLAILGPLFSRLLEASGSKR